MSATSEVQICNAALLRLGAQPITSFTDGTVSSTICNQMYALTRDLLLRQHTWNFATKRVSLAADSTTPAFEWEYQYPLPSDFIRVDRIYEQISDYSIEGSYLLTNQTAPLKLVYIAQITDPTKFDVLFVEALVLLLAVKMGTRINGDGFDSGRLMTEAADVLRKAQMVDGQDAVKQLVITNYTDYRDNNLWLGNNPMRTPD